MRSEFRTSSGCALLNAGYRYTPVGPDERPASSQRDLPPGSSSSLSFMVTTGGGGIDAFGSHGRIFTGPEGRYLRPAKQWLNVSSPDTALHGPALDSPSGKER
jgi:hypothetical protein